MTRSQEIHYDEAPYITTSLDPWKNSIFNIPASDNLISAVVLKHYPKLLSGVIMTEQLSENERKVFREAWGRVARLHQQLIHDISDACQINKLRAMSLKKLQQINKVLETE